MFKRKLQALGFPNPDLFNSSDDRQFRNLVLWLEDQKIRRYKIEEREPLRNATTDNWNEVFGRYLTDLDCPFFLAPRPELIDWLLALAVQLEFTEKTELYTSSAKTLEQATTKSNPLDNLDFESSDFKQGVNQLADILQVPKHPNHLVTLEGICNLLKIHFSEQAIGNVMSKTTVTGKLVQFDSLNFGMDLKDPNFKCAANVLRYLFINDLRSLQTKINECLVSVQALTANPKTDTKLGQVGY